MRNVVEFGAVKNGDFLLNTLVPPKDFLQAQIMAYPAAPVEGGAFVPFLERGNAIQEPVRQLLGPLLERGDRAGVEEIAKDHEAVPVERRHVRV